MRFLYDDDQAALQRSTRSVLTRQAELDARRPIQGSTGVDRASWAQGGTLGWFSMLVPEARGGGSMTGQGPVDVAALAEEWGRALARGPLISTNVAAMALGAHGSDAQAALLGPIQAGSTVITWCVAEEHGDWDPDRGKVEVSRRRDPDGGVRLTGEKVLVEAAGSAEWLLVSVHLGDGRVGEVLVRSDAPGVTITPHRSLDLTRDLDRVIFDGTPISEADRLPGAGPEAVRRQLDVAASLACADSVGGAAKVLEMTVDYTRQRVQFGRTIASFQAVRHRCADMAAALEGAAAATRYAALALAEGTADAASAVDLAKAHVGDACAAITGEGIQLHGGIGFTWDHDLHRYARRAKTNEVLFGTTAWRRQRSWDRLVAAAEV